MKLLLRKVISFISSKYPQIIFFLITFSLGVTIFIILRGENNLFSITDYTSSSYLLSALVQSLAAMLAIVLTLTMVSIQLVAQFLSYRIIRVFVSKGIPLIVFFVYAFSIVFNALLLSRNNSVNFEHNIPQINIALLLFFGCIIYLIPYTWYLVNLLEPLKTIDMFMKKVRKMDIVSYPEVIIYGKGEKEYVALPRMSQNEDPLQPVFEILDLSFGKKNPDTVRGIIISFGQKILQLLDISNDEKESFKITFYFVEHLKRINEKALLELPDKDVLVEILDLQCNILEENILSSQPISATLVLDCLRDISKDFVNKRNLEDAVTFTVPWHLVPILLDSPRDKRLLRVKANLLNLIAELDYVTNGNFLAKEVFLTHEQEIAKTKEDKETARFYRLKFERQRKILSTREKR